VTVDLLTYCFAHDQSTVCWQIVKPADDLWVTFSHLYLPFAMNHHLFRFKMKSFLKVTFVLPLTSRTPVTELFCISFSLLLLSVVLMGRWSNFVHSCYVRYVLRCAVNSGVPRGGRGAAAPQTCVTIFGIFSKFFRMFLYVMKQIYSHILVILCTCADT